jgi:hypothetical protein
VIVTGSVTDRVLAARSSYPREAGFYDALRSRTAWSTTSTLATAARALGLDLPGFNGAVKRLGVLALAAFALAGCGANDSVNASAKLRCPAKARAGWQHWPNRIHAPVFCPAWMPDPLDGVIGSQWNNINEVSRDRSYLMSWVWQETGPGAAGGEKHVNLRGLSGRTVIPKCVNADSKQRN